MNISNNRSRTPTRLGVKTDLGQEHKTNGSSSSLGDKVESQE